MISASYADTVVWSDLYTSAHRGDANTGCALRGCQREPAIERLGNHIAWVQTIDLFASSFWQANWIVQAMSHAGRHGNSMGLYL